MTARMRASAAARAASSGYNQQSPNVVMPARSISAIASCVPSRTRSGLPLRSSAGHTISRIQRSTGGYHRSARAHHARGRARMCVHETGQECVIRAEHTLRYVEPGLQLRRRGRPPQCARRTPLRHDLRAQRRLAQSAAASGARSGGSAVNMLYGKASKSGKTREKLGREYIGICCHPVGYSTATYWVTCVKVRLSTAPGSNVGNRSRNRAGQSRRRDAAVLPRLCDERDRRACSA